MSQVAAILDPSKMEFWPQHPVQSKLSKELLPFQKVPYGYLQAKKTKSSCATQPCNTFATLQSWSYFQPRKVAVSSYTVTPATLHVKLLTPCWSAGFHPKAARMPTCPESSQLQAIVRHHCCNSQPWYDPLGTCRSITPAKQCHLSSRFNKRGEMHMKLSAIPSN